MTASHVTALVLTVTPAGGDADDDDYNNVTSSEPKTKKQPWKPSSETHRQE